MGRTIPKCPERLHAIGDRLIGDGLDGYLAHHTAPAATRRAARARARPGYIATLEAASPASGLHYIDPDTALNPHSLTAARHAAGAVVLATDLVMRGECRNAFCAVRPPGHHAERDRAMGFCLFNNVAVGAAHALAAHGLARVAIVDFDVHHGNGTEDIFADDPRVLMVVDVPASAVSVLRRRAARRRTWSTFRCRRAAAATAFRDAVARALAAGARARIARRSSSSPPASTRTARIRWPGSQFTEADYAWVTRELIAVAERHAQGRIVSTLEGGYALSALGRSAAEHVRELVAA